MSYICRRLGLQSVSRLFSQQSNTDCEKKKSTFSGAHWYSAPLTEEEVGKAGRNARLGAPGKSENETTATLTSFELLWINICISKDGIFVKCTCDLSSRSFPMVASHQGQHTGCFADSAPAPKEHWRWCRVSGASLGAITFQRENKLTTFVRCTSMIITGKEEKSRCERSCALYANWQMDAASTRIDAGHLYIFFFKQALSHAMACLASTVVKVHAFSTLTLALLASNTGMHGHEKWHASTEAPSGWHVTHRIGATASDDH